MSFVNILWLFLGIAYLQPILAIVGGYHSPNNTYADSIVSLRDSTGHRCAGTILTERLILTAAHCFGQKYKIQYVVWGNNRLKKSNPQFEIEKLLIHPSFNPLNYKADIALIYLKRDDQKDAFLPLINARPIEGTKCLTLGWGRIASPGPLADEIIFADFTIASMRDCYVSPILNRGQFCFYDADDNTKAISYQDDGGPLICNGALSGIISYSIPSSRISYWTAMLMRTLNVKTISFATDVAFYEEWIIEAAEKLDPL